MGCILCNDWTSNKDFLFCKDCYYNVVDRVEEINKHQGAVKLKDYYYNAKDYAMRIYNENKIYYQQLTMCAIAQILIDNYNDNSIMERLENDIKKVNDNLKNKNTRLNTTVKEQSKIEEIKINNDEQKAKTYRTQDGHFVESELEIKIDDLLYNNNILHAYNTKVDEISERSVYCDWFIPIINDKGIYIELWGIKNNTKYNENREEKSKLYKSHNLRVIDIEYSEMQGDTQRLKSNLIGQIKKLKNEILDEQKY